MKKLTRNALLILCGWALLVQSGCYGSFSLTKQLYDWNDTVGEKFTKSLLFFVLCVIPVYEVCAIVDAVILNLIEFWSGSNPLSMKEGQHEQQLVTKNGIDYKLEATKNQFTITQLSGKEKGKMVHLVYAPGAKTWNVEKDGQLTAISKMEVGADGQPVARIFKADHQSIMVKMPTNESELAQQMRILRAENVAVH